MERVSSEALSGKHLTADTQSNHVGFMGEHGKQWGRPSLRCLLFVPLAFITRNYPIP
jgi:hypothetical protein